MIVARIFDLTPTNFADNVRHEGDLLYLQQRIYGRSTWDRTTWEELSAETLTNGGGTSARRTSTTSSQWVFDTILNHQLIADISSDDEPLSPGARIWASNGDRLATKPGSRWAILPHLSPLLILKGDEYDYFSPEVNDEPMTDEPPMLPTNIPPNSGALYPFVEDFNTIYLNK